MVTLPLNLSSPFHSLPNLRRRFGGSFFGNLFRFEPRNIQLNIDAIQHAAESSRNRFLEKQIKTVAVPTMLKYGTEFAKAMEMTTFFPEMVISRFRTASETGSVKQTAVQVADYYEMENRYAMKNLINVIEVGVSMVIMGSMVFLTLLSSATATIKIEPKTKQQQQAEPDTIIWLNQ